MTGPRVVSRESWLRARRDLLAEEKELTRRRDAVAAQRRALAMVAVDRSYTFEGHDGSYHSYSVYQRGLDQLMAPYTLLDLSPLGRQEDAEPWAMDGFACTTTTRP